MKTPMQELIEWLDKHGDNRIYGGRELSVHEIKNHAKSMLEKEKEVIMRAYSQGRRDTDNLPLIVELKYTSRDYYNETFKTTEK